MVDQLTLTKENTERILEVEALFGVSGKPLAKPGRVLVGEGQLLKLCRRSPQLKVFFLFDDILVYGSVVLLGRWYANQQVVPLEELALEDTADGPGMRNCWLVRTPRKSFYVSATSAQEKRAWMEHIWECRAKRLELVGRPPRAGFAAVWVPLRTVAVCMRCRGRFGMAQRRHHCRQCGFVVCGPCSRGRAIILNISSRPVRVCLPCYYSLQGQAAQMARNQGLGAGGSGSDEDEAAMPVHEASSDEEREDECEEDPIPSQWVSYARRLSSTCEGQ
ncbi:pleckstrin homology domain-containing family F member 2-like [Megalops cyprinoides]|uniref:pleckstrin homology domain-containing family F member 2-like n=1 Tax=Megalops cyprinoides TaxID=118141 RepID=UPI0018642240|nr:pleckstrin homology domain-containing family F member 2-like [Megalops cyprinoides]